MEGDFEGWLNFIMIYLPYDSGGLGMERFWILDFMIASDLMFLFYLFMYKIPFVLLLCNL